MCFSYICLFVLRVYVFVIFPYSLCRGLAAVCDCGIPWTFLLTFYSEEIRTVIRKSESYPALSKSARNSYPSLLQHSSAKNVALSSTSIKKCTFHSASLIPLLEKSERSDHTKRATDSVKRK